MTCSFPASVVSFEPIEGVWTVGFSETPSGEGHYVLLQREEFESPAGEYLELNEQLSGAYGAVERVCLHRSKIALFVATDARAKLGEEKIDVVFNLSLADFQSLRSALVQILGVSRVHLA